MAVRRVEEGEKPSEVIQSYGFCRTVIYRWLRQSREGGEEALRSRRAPGPQCQLTAKQKQAVRNWISGKDPRQYGFDFGLWTRKAVADLIDKKFGVRLSVTSVGRLLAELDITPQKPLRRAYERDPESIEHWLKVDYPKLRRRAKDRGADIFSWMKLEFAPTYPWAGLGLRGDRHLWFKPVVNAKPSMPSRQSMLGEASGIRRSWAISTRLVL